MSASSFPGGKSLKYTTHTVIIGQKSEWYLLRPSNYLGVIRNVDLHAMPVSVIGFSMQTIIPSDRLLCMSRDGRVNLQNEVNVKSVSNNCGFRKLSELFEGTGNKIMYKIDVFKYVCE